jgi:SAM-dependent methyltransferase
MRSREQFEREFPLFSQIEMRARDFDCLIYGNKTVDSIANFGCATGVETLGLVHAFGALEAVGIDIDGDGLFQAVQTVEGLKCAAVSVAHRAAYYREECHEWWRDLVPDFIKGLVLDRIPEGLAQGVRETTVGFIQADITRAPCVASDHFDLVYCDHVLYHVYCDQGERELQRAVSGMAQVVAAGGCVVAVEPLTCSPESAEALDFAGFFQRAGLQCCDRAHEPLHREDRVRTYSYEKPATSAT